MNKKYTIIEIEIITKENNINLLRVSYKMVKDNILNKLNQIL